LLPYTPLFRAERRVPAVRDPDGAHRGRPYLGERAPAQRHLAGPGRVHQRGRGPRAPDHLHARAGLDPHGGLHRPRRPDDLLRVPRRDADLPARRHPRPPPPAADRRADRLRGARRGVLPHEPRVLRPGRRVHHHRTRRRDRVPRRHHAEGAPVITIDAVRKQYTSATETVEIGPVTVEIPSGGVTALVGPNGAGKSTLLTMAGRLLGIDDGAIEVAGYDIASTASKDLAKILSVLRQENHFITRLTVRQLVGFGRFP